jgi:hypothetical protein
LALPVFDVLRTFPVRRVSCFRPLLAQISPLQFPLYVALCIFLSSIPAWASSADPNGINIGFDFN